MFRNRLQTDELEFSEEFVKQFILGEKPNQTVVVPAESLLLPTHSLSEEIIQIEKFYQTNIREIAHNWSAWGFTGAKADH